MSIRETIQIGDPRLKAENQTVVDFQSEKVKQVINDLIETMRTKELIGMAAPQIGENWKIFVTDPRQTETRSVDQADELRVYINPKIIEMSEEETIIYEGCGSVMEGNLFGPVKRPKVIAIEAFDLEGKKFTLKCDGILARVIQHEYDHLIGIEFTDKVSDYKKLVNREFYLKDIKDSKEQVEAGKITMKEVQ